MRIAALLVLALAISACLDGPTDSPPTTTTTTTTQPTPCVEQAAPVEPDRASDIDGSAALEWVEQIVHLPDGELRPRVPSMDDHPCTADWLEQVLQHAGWTVGRSDFTGADVQAIPNNPASYWETRCSSGDAEEVANMELTNLWATYGTGDQTLLIAAHWDAKEDTSDTDGPVPAANDGASGMGVILELQRAITAAGVDLPYRLAVAFFDAEDGFEDCHPLAGSHHFAHHTPIDVDRLILLDMVGDAGAMFPRESNSVDSDPQMVDLVWSLAAQHGLDDHFLDQEKPVVDDHLPFVQKGIPSIDIIDYARPGTAFPPYWHTSEDMVDKLDAGMMGDMAALLLDVLQDPLLDGPWGIQGAA